MHLFLNSPASLGFISCGIYIYIYMLRKYINYTHTHIYMQICRKGAIWWSKGKCAVRRNVKHMSQISAKLGVKHAEYHNETSYPMITKGK